jgi:hypothetical protein
MPKFLSIKIKPNVNELISLLVSIMENVCKCITKEWKEEQWKKE